MRRASKNAKLHHSDSEGTIGNLTFKRQKVESDHPSSNGLLDVVMADETQRHVYNPDRNENLKGRKRFNADLTDIQAASNAGLVFSGLTVKRIRPGDDEGSVELLIQKTNLEHVLTANLLISDTSEYPKSHSVFCYSPDGNLSARLQRIVDETAEEPPRPLGRTVRELVVSVAQAINTKSPATGAQKQEETDVEDMDSDEGDDYNAFDEDDDIGIVPPESNSVSKKLQATFVDIVATEYRPGFIRLSGNDFVLSISLPLITLANIVPPRALMAWDRRLLASPQHLTLLISGFHGLYPVFECDAAYTPIAQRLGVCLNFKVGLCERYKPARDQVQEIIRKHGLVTLEAEDELRIQAERSAQQRKLSAEGETDGDDEDVMVTAEECTSVDHNRFDRFSLSSSLESLLDQSFLKLVQIRRKYGLGWAGAEVLHSESEKLQMKEHDVLTLKAKEISVAEEQETHLQNLPHDPLLGLGADGTFNLPLTAFCYLIRRLSLCTRYCTVCHNKLQSGYEALKPYVCESKLCAYQYYALNRGPSLEYEIIQNPQTVDLLVSLAYSSAVDGVMDEPFPIGMGLRVPLPTSTTIAPQSQSYPSFAGFQLQQAKPPEIPKELQPGSDDLVDFDELTLEQMRSCIATLINTLPSVADMKKHLEQKVKAGKRKAKLQDIDPNVLPAAWSILRWCVASCTAHIEAITSPAETIKNLDPSWRQFRMTVGSPAAEAKFSEAISSAQSQNPKAVEYPVIYAFHGSPLRNWHSIIRHGLWYKSVSHGRAFGHGVYLARDGTTSTSYFTQSSRSAWQKSLIVPSNCMALAEIVNRPSEFVCSNPHYVVKDTHWIMCRYLLVKSTAEPNPSATASSDDTTESNPNGRKKKGKKKFILTPYVKLDPQHMTQMASKVIEIPDPAFQVDFLLSARKNDYVYEEPDEDDLAIFQFGSKQGSKSCSQFHDSEHDYYDGDETEDYNLHMASSTTKKPANALQRPKNDWKHAAEYVKKTLENLMIPPFQSSTSASLAIQRELRAMVKEQDAAPSLRDLGWYMPPDLIGDNLYQWIVEMHSFDSSLPIAKDMKAKKVNSIIFEIRFPPTFPNLPPFFRIITPRFLPFIQGGGGHVTGGGSICMDLLTSDGWLPSYSVSALLMQIRLAISNFEPRPARLASNWNQPYDVAESLVGYKRAAATHNWTIPEGLDRLVR